MSFVRILQWNCRGIIPKLPLLERLLFQFNIDIFCIQEAKLHPPSIVVSIRGYSVNTLYNTNVPGGGLLIGVRTNLPYYQELSCSSSTYGLQKLRIPFRNLMLHILNFYAPKGLTDPSIYYHYFTDQSSTLILGDFNAQDMRFGSYKSNLAGDILFKWYSSSSYNLLNNGSGTHVHPGSLDTCILDLSFASSDITSLAHWSVTSEPYDSDHFPVIIHLQLEHTFPRYHHTYFRTSKFHPMLQLLDSLPQYSDLSLPEKLSQVSKMIRRVATPHIKLHWWNPTVHQFIQTKRRLFRRARRNPLPRNWIQYKQACAQAQKAIRQAKRSAWENFLNKLKDQHIFRIYRVLKNKLSPSPPSSRFLQINNQLVADPISQAQAFATYFTSFTSSVPPSSLLTASPYSSTLDAAFSMTELHSALQATRSSTPGPDNIPSSFLKILSSDHQQQLLDFFNQVWTSGNFPTDWLSSTLIPLSKPGKDPLLLESYRPILLTSAICKLHERMILKRLLNHATTNQIFHHNQYGFLRNRSAIDCASSIYYSLKTHRQQGRFVVLLALDIQKAYDHVDRHLLLHYFHSHFPSTHCFNWIKGFLQPRSIRVRWNNHISAPQSSTVGVPQGSVLSPFLFNLYLRSLFNFLTKIVELYIFADDIYLISSGSTLAIAIQFLQQALRQLVEWCTRHNFHICMNKSKVMNCSSRRSLHIPSIILNGNTLQWSESIPILGIIFSSTLRWSHHFSSLLRKAGVFLQIIKLLTSKRSGGSIHSLIHLVRCTLMPSLTYGSFLTGTAPKYVKQKLQVLINQSLRLILGVPRSCPNLVLYRESGIYPVSQWIIKSHLLYIHKHLGIKETSQWSHTLHSIIYSPAHQYRYFPPVNLYHTLIRDLHIQKHPLLQVQPQEWSLPSNICLHLRLFLGPKEQMIPTEIRQTFQLFKRSFDFPATWIFTDGSKSSTHSGFGIFLPDSNLSISIGIPSLCSAFTAEVFAIIYALTHYCTHPGTYFIVTDNKSVLQALDSSPKNPHAALNLLFQHLTNLKSSISIHFVWVPSHMDISDNDSADAAAKRALTLPVDPAYLFLPYQDYRHYLISRCQEFASKPWITSKYASLYSHIPPNPDHHLTRGISRSMVILLTQLRTFTAPLNAFLYRIRQISSPNCRACAVPETVQHYIQDCQLFRQQRQLFQSLYSSCDALKILEDSYTSVHHLNVLIHYIHQSGRFHR